MAVVVSATPSDFTPLVRRQLRSKVASEVGVDRSAVELNVRSVLRRMVRRALQGASSVQLTFTIALPSAVASANAVQALSNRLASTASASAFLSTPSYTATVLSIAVAPVAYHPPSPPFPNPPSPHSPAAEAVTENWLGFAAVSAAALALACCFGAVLAMRKSRSDGRARSLTQTAKAQSQARV